MKKIILAGLLSLVSITAYADQLMLAIEGSRDLTDCSTGQCNTVVVRSLNPHVKQGDTFNLSCTFSSMQSNMMPGNVKFDLDSDSTLVTSGPTTLLPTQGDFSKEFTWTGKALKDGHDVLLSFDSPKELTGEQSIHVQCANQ